MGGGAQLALMWHFVKMGPAPIPQIFQFFELLIWRHSCIGIPMRYGKSKVEWIQNIHGNSHTPLENKGGHEFQGGLGNPKGCQISKTPWGFQWQSLFPAREAVVLLVLLVTWVLRTPNPLNSAKSPWVVYVPNFSLLVRPLLINFGVGSSSSCCSCSCSCSSCDRGKTKSTPSLKT